MACSGTKKTKQSLTLNDKLEILKTYDSTGGNVKMNELAKKLKISRSTLITIINNRKTIEDAPESDRHRFRARNRRDNPYAGKSKYQVLDETLAEWVRNLKASNKPFNGVILRNKALELAAEMGFENFTASNGWSDRFKKKYDLEYKTKLCYCLEKPQSSDKTPINTSYSATSFLDRVIAEMQFNTDSKFSSKDIEEKLMQWLCEAKNDQAKITGKLIKEMALTLAGVLGITNFTAHTGWLSRFEKKFYLLRYKKCKNCQNNKGMDAKNEEKLVADELADDCKALESSIEDSDDEEHSKKKRKVANEDVLANQINNGALEALSDGKVSKLPNNPERVKLFTYLSNKLQKEEEYQQIKLRLDKMEVELDVLKLASELIKIKKINLQLDIENSKLKLHLLNSL